MSEEKIERITIKHIHHLLKGVIMPAIDNLNANIAVLQESVKKVQDAITALKVPPAPPVDQEAPIQAAADAVAAETAKLDASIQ